MAVRWGLIIRQKLLGRNDTFPPIERAEKRGVRNGTQRHSLPQPVERRSQLVVRPRSFWFRPQQSTQDELESTPTGWSDPLPTSGDPDVGSLGGNSRRHSTWSVTSTGAGSTTSLHDSRSRPGNWHSSDRLSLNSNVSSSSGFTGSSGSTASTFLTTPHSGTISKRSSRSSVLQREKRFSNVKCELDAICCLVQVLNSGSTSDGWDTVGVG